MKRVLICGASGYIGSALTPYLCSHGFKVTAVDKIFVSSALRDACRFDNLEIVKADCLDPAQLERLVVDTDVIYWLVGATSGDEAAMHQANVTTARNLARLVWDTQTIVFPMTNAGYQCATPSHVVTELTPMRGMSPYSQTKIEAERVLAGTGKCVSFRLASVYGPAPNMRWATLLNAFCRWAVLGSGAPLELYQAHAIRDVIYIADLVRRMTLPLFVDLRGGVFNLSGQSLAKLDLLQAVKPDGRYIVVDNEDVEQRNFFVSEEKFRRAHENALGYEVATTPLERGIAATLKAARLEAL